ncbi:unnamed protein product [Rotaria sp. Silwood1]|nr:unnamed protein product [Rotaria sp. Silwood1]CAF1619915.1 unnamed protein product [Rotaria sp. Silwood1]
MSAQQDQQSIDNLLDCPITGTRFVDPVIADDGYTYERQAIVEWLRQKPVSPITRQPMSIDCLRSNRIVKQMLDVEKKAERQSYRFKLNIDVKKKRNRALFQNGDKFIYEAEWLNNEQGPEIVLLHIRGARASKEASFYAKLSRHPNIIRTLGVVESSTEENMGIMLLQEYAPLGDLSELLLNQPRLPDNVHIFCEIFLQIIDAMTFLASKNIVHGDLACRNILVFSYHHTDPEKILVKLTDFGLTRASTIYQRTNYVASTINTVPIRSSAPEILQSPNDRQFYTEKSDIFSMGVLMWECLSKGAIPWVEKSDDEVIRNVLNGERLKRPRNGQCSDDLWAIILKCMAHRPEDRPTFVQLDRLISNLFSNRVSMFSRYAQYAFLQHQRNGETNSNSRLSTAISATSFQPSPATVASVDSRQATVSEEKMVLIEGPLIIQNDGRAAGYFNCQNDFLGLGGSNLYSSGTHRIKLQFMACEGITQIEFFGIISDSLKYQASMTHWTEMACTYGCGTRFKCEKGKRFPKAEDLPIRNGTVIQLALDCSNHKIYYKNGNSYVQEILIDTQVCPFPWKWRLRFFSKTGCLRLT